MRHFRTRNEVAVEGGVTKFARAARRLDAASGCEAPRWKSL